MLAAGWLALFWPRPRAALLFVAGPLLAPLGLLGLIPLVVLPAGDAARRAAQAAAAVLAAAAVAALAGNALPIVGGAAPDLALAGVGGPFGAAGRSCTESPKPARCSSRCSPSPQPQPPSARSAAAGRGAARVFGALLAASTLLVAPDAAALPLVAAAWLCGLALAVEPARPWRPGRLATRVRGLLPLRPRLRPVHGS